MSNKKESEGKNNNINSYRYLAGSGRDIRRQHSSNLYSLLTDSVNRITNNATSLYSNNIVSEEFRCIADEIPQRLKTYLNRIVILHDVFGSELIPDIQEEFIQKMGEIDFASLFAARFKRIDTLSFDKLRDIVEYTYKTVQEEIEDSLEADNDVLSEEEIKEAIDEQINNPKGFQERIKEWSDKKIVRYYIIWQLICFIYSNFFQPYFQQNIGVPVTAWVVSNVKELPQKGAEVVCQIKEGVEAVIIENTNYYYKVSFTDENGVKQEGYVAKKNLKLIEQDKEDATEGEK